MQHTWPAYRDALKALLEDNPLPRLIARPPRPTTLVIGEADHQTPSEDLLGVRHDRVDVIRVTGDHLLALTAPRLLADRIREVLSADVQAAERGDARRARP